MLSVLAAIIALVLGVAIVPVTRTRPSWMAALDGFMLVGVGGVLVMGLLPYSIEMAGGWAIAAAGVGVSLPVLLERGHNHDAHAHDSFAFLTIAALGLAVHAFLDGGALAARQIEDAKHTRALELGVLLHRLPMGLMLGMLGGLHRQRQAWMAAGLVAIGTIAGFAIGVEALPMLGLKGLALFQALVAGTLVHVIYTHSPIRSPSGHRRASTIGMLGGLLFLAAIKQLHHG
jgi:uncharacterized protein